MTNFNASVWKIPSLSVDGPMFATIPILLAILILQFVIYLYLPKEQVWVLRFSHRRIKYGSMLPYGERGLKIGWAWSKVGPGAVKEQVKKLVAVFNIGIFF